MRWHLYLNGVNVEELQNWQIQYKCRLCSSVIYSKFSNQTSECECGAISVEQTPFMNFKRGKDENFIDPNKPVEDEFDDIGEFNYGYDGWF